MSRDFRFLQRSFVALPGLVDAAGSFQIKKMFEALQKKCGASL
jgi:hypothetical protein